VGFVSLWEYVVSVFRWRKFAVKSTNLFCPENSNYFYDLGGFAPLWTWQLWKWFSAYRAKLFRLGNGCNVPCAASAAVSR